MIILRVVVAMPEHGLRVGDVLVLGAAAVLRDLPHAALVAAHHPEKFDPVDIRSLAKIVRHEKGGGL